VETGFLRTSACAAGLLQATRDGLDRVGGPATELGRRDRRFRAVVLVGAGAVRLRGGHVSQGGSSWARRGPCDARRLVVFWTKPYRKQSVGMSSWGSEFHHLLAWALSFNLAKKHLSKTALYTDSEGARFLADDLGLEFDQVSTELNNIRNYDPEWWSLGKLYTL